MSQCGNPDDKETAVFKQIRLQYPNLEPGSLSVGKRDTRHGQAALYEVEGTDNDEYVYGGECLMAWFGSKRQQSLPAQRPSVLNYPRLFKTVYQDSERFAEADPFPHIVIDNFLDQDVLSELVNNFPEPDHESWVVRNARSEDGTDQQRNKFDYVLGRGISRRRPGFVEYEMTLHPTVRNILLELNSSTFVGYLQQLTRINRMVSDPNMWGGGLHQTSAGGLLNIHADFLKHPVFGFDRRLNMLLYLNEGWQSAWGGELELWAPDMQRCVQAIEPTANRCVIFATSEKSFHGHSKPLTCPEGVFRRSIAAYYYTVPGAAEMEKVVTDWQQTPARDADD